MVVASPTEEDVQATYAPLHGRLRSAYAVKEFLGDREELLPPIINRILAISALIPTLLADPKFSPFMHCDSESGVAMSESLLEAFAEAPFAPGTLTYDADALYSITVQREFHAQHPTGN